MLVVTEATDTSKDSIEAFSEQFMQAILDDNGEIAESHLAAGNPIYIGDPEYPNYAIKEYPDGRRHVVDIDRKGIETVIKELQ